MGISLENMTLKNYLQYATKIVNTFVQNHFENLNFLILSHFEFDMGLLKGKTASSDNKPTRLISPLGPGPKVGLLSGDHCTVIKVIVLTHNVLKMNLDFPLLGH